MASCHLGRLHYQGLVPINKHSRFRPQLHSPELPPLTEADRKLRPQSSPSPSSLLADRSIESPFSLRYNYPVVDDRPVDSKDDQTMMARLSLANTSSLNESGAYDQLMFSSTLQPPPTGANRDPNPQITQKVRHIC